LEIKGLLWNIISCFECIERIHEVPSLLLKGLYVYLEFFDIERCSKSCMVPWWNLRSVFHERCSFISWLFLG
jgi:hypothetical protein